MAVKKFIIVAGQNNALESGDAVGWEDLHPFVALRSPAHNAKTQAPQFTGGAYTDNLSMPLTMAGGPRPDRLGGGTAFGAWQNANIIGRAMQGVRFLTPYDPSASYTNIGTSSATNYPGTCEVLATPVPTSTTITTNARWLWDPTGLKLTRRKTGTTHTMSVPGSWVNASSVTTSVTLTPPLVPPPQVGEQFEYEIASGAASGSADQLVLANQFGGWQDTGSTLDVPSTSGAVETGKYQSVISSISGADLVLTSARVTLKGRPITVGSTVQFAVPTASSAFSSGATAVGAVLSMPSGSTMPWAVGDRIVFNTADLGGATLPTGLAADTAYYVTAAVGLGIELSTDAGGTSITLGTGFVPTATGPVARPHTSLPSSVTAGLDYYVTRKATPNESITLTAANWNDTGGAYINMPGESLADGEPVWFSGTLPTGISKTQRYFVKPRQIVATNTLTETGTMTVWAPGGSNQYGLLYNEELNFDWVDAGYVPGDEIVITGCSNAANNGHFRILAWNQIAAPYATARLQTVGNTIPGLVDETSTAGVSVSKVTHTAQTGLYVSSTKNGALISWNATGGGESAILREDSASAFYISATRGGIEIVAYSHTGSYESASTIRATAATSFRGSLTGLQARCVSAFDPATELNVGASVDLSDVDFAAYTAVSGVNWHYSTVQCASDWPVAPQAGDKFVIEPAPQSNESVPFYKLAMLLPWCPFEGRSSYRGPASATLGGDLGADLWVQVSSSDIVLPEVKSVIQLQTTGVLISPLQPGRDYYIQRIETITSTTAKLYLKDAYDGTAAIIGDGSIAQSGVHSMTVWDQQDKINPYPPGFNYPNHHGTPRPYQAFEGPSLIGQNPRMGISTGLALKMHEYLGETMNVAVCAVDRTSIGHQEIYNNVAGSSSYSWLDPTQQKSWSAGESNNCFSRLEDVLDSIKLALAAQGDTGECVGVFWIQGEEDAFFSDFSANYELNGTRFKAALRDAIKSRSLFAGPADQIPFVWPKIKSTPWEYATAVNAAIGAMVNADAYCRTYSAEDITLMPESAAQSAAEIGADYNGAGQSKAVGLAYAAWRSIERSGTTKLDVCRLALSNLGDTATITSVDPPDDSVQAKLCAQYWKLALNKSLQRHDWDFSIRRTSPTELPTDRTEWLYSYTLPSDYVGVVAVLPKDTTDDSNQNGIRLKLKYAVEIDNDHTRRLYCNEQSVVLRYNALVYDLAQWTDSAIIALGWMLSSMLAPPLIKGVAGMEAARNAIQMSDYQLQQAAGFDTGTTREKYNEDDYAPWDQRMSDSRWWGRHL